MSPFFVVEPNNKPLLPDFLADLIKDERYNPTHIRWLNKDELVFLIVKPKVVASMWGSKKGNPNMNYPNMSRGMRCVFRFWDNDRLRFKFAMQAHDRSCLIILLDRKVWHAAPTILALTGYGINLILVCIRLNLAGNRLSQQNPLQKAMMIFVYLGSPKRCVRKIVKKPTSFPEGFLKHMVLLEWIWSSALFSFLNRDRRKSGFFVSVPPNSSYPKKLTYKWGPKAAKYFT